MYEIFEQLLLKYGVTAYKVGKETGIASSTFTAWKNGISEPKKEKLQKIANFFNVSVEYLMGVESENNNSNMDAEDLRRLQIIKINPDIRVLVDETAELNKKDIDFILEMVRKIKN